MKLFGGIQQRISVTVMSLLVLLTIAVAWSVVRVNHRNTFAAVSDQIHRDQRAFKILHERRILELLNRARFLAAEPKIIAALGTPDIDRETVQFLADEIRSDGNLDMLVIRGRAAGATAFSFRDIRSDIALISSIQMPAADSGYAAIGAKDAHVVSVPVEIGGMRVGWVTIGDYISKASVEDLNRLISSDMVLCLEMPERPGRIAATTMTALAKNDLRAALDSIETKENGAREIRLPPAGEPYLCLSSFADPFLKVIFLKSLAPARATAAAIVKTVIVVAFCFLLISYVMIKFLSKAITRPIRRLVEGTEAIASGNLNVKTDIAGPIELQRLSQSFDKMAERIKDLLNAEERAKAQLEVRVKERTADLVETNRLLVEAHQDLKEQTTKRIQYEKLAGLGTMAAGVAHEINNPLTVIIGRAQALSESMSEPPAKRTAETIWRAAVRCGNVVKSMLRFSRQEGPQRAPVNVPLMLDLAVEIVKSRGEYDHIRVVRQYQPDLPYVLMDETLIEQAVSNILLNACQSMKDAHGKGTLTIEAVVVGGHLKMRFADDGPGMTPEVATRIFDPFFTTRGVGKGAGLGMSVAHGIVDQHAGKIIVEKTGPGGTTIVIVLPMPAQIQIAEEKREARPADGIVIKDRKVLVVDDEPDIQDMVRGFLEFQGCVVVTAGSGEEALGAMAQNGEFDVILVDIRMPGMDGFEFYRRVAAQHAAAVSHIVFVTGDTLSPEIHEFLKETGRASIAKPFRMHDLPAVICKVSGQAEIRT